MKPEYRKKAGQTTREKKGGRVMRKNSARVRVQVEDLDVSQPVPVDVRPAVNRVTLDNNFPGGFRMEPGGYQ